MACSPITSWQIEGEKVEALTVLFFCTPKPLQMGSATKLKDISSLEGKRYDKTRQCIKKQRHHFANRGPYSQSYVFTVVINGCESWTIKKVECQRTDAFGL